MLVCLPPDCAGLRGHDVASNRSSSPLGMKRVREA